MIRMGQRRQRPRRRAVVEEEPEEEEEEEAEAEAEAEEAEAEEEFDMEAVVEVVAEEEAAEGPHTEPEASGLVLEEPQHQEEEFHHQEEVLDSEGDSELEIVEIPSRAPLGLPLPSPGWSVPAIGQLSATVDRQVQTSPGLDLEEGELPSSPEPGEREPGCREEVQQLRAQVAAQEQQLHHLQNHVIWHLQHHLALQNQALRQLWESHRRLQDMLYRLLQHDLH